MPAVDHWRICHFLELHVAELQNIYMARQMVFVVEQECAYLDADGFDDRGWHLAAWSAAHRPPLAYARLLEPGAKYGEPSIGRVITTTPARGSGLGRTLVRRAVAECGRLWPGAGVRISAQSYLARFYGEVGFVAVSDDYLEDGIPHVEMLLSAADGAAAARADSLRVAG